MNTIKREFEYYGNIIPYDVCHTGLKEKSDMEYKNYEYIGSSCVYYINGVKNTSVDLIHFYKEKGEAREIDYYLVKKECWGVDGTLWTKANILATDNSISLPYFQEIGLLSNPDYFTPVYKEVKPKFKVGDYCKKVWKEGDVDYFDAAQVTEEGIRASEYYRIHNGTIEDVSKYSNGREDARFNDERCTLSVIPKSEFDEVKQRYLAAEKIMIGRYEVKFECGATSIDGNKFTKEFWEAALEVSKHSKASVVVGCNAKGLGTHKWEVTQEQIEKIISKLN